jgi:hypothetical protein
MDYRPRAVCLVREAPHYRRNAFLDGLRAAGFQITNAIGDPRPGDVLVIWNRYTVNDITATRFEKAGAAVFVTENGYLGHHYDDYAKPFHQNGEQLFALALGHHNGAGQWHVGGPGRWREQGLTTAPWRRAGDHVLVLPQRGIGPLNVAMPAEWPAKAVQRLKAMTARPVRVRPHPGNAPAKKPLAADLGHAWCVVTWGSGAALKAICAGVPCFSDFPHWIGNPATFDLGQDIEQPLTDDWAREHMLDRLAWAQWDLGEIASGEPFGRLMAIYQEQRKAA